MPKMDVYGRAHELDPATVDAIAARLEARRESPRYMRMLHDYLDELDLAAARDVLALGAGTGVEVRELVRRTEFSGTVTALEISERLVEIGRRKAEEEGVADRITWQIGDAQALDLPDRSFDLVTAHTLLSHVDEPVRVLEEARRVLRPGGTLVVFDGDYATLTFGTEDPDEGRAWDERIIRAIVANPRVMRALPRHFRRLGLELVGCACLRPQRDRPSRLLRELAAVVPGPPAARPGGHGGGGGGLRRRPVSRLGRARLFRGLQLRHLHRPPDRPGCVRNAGSGCEPKPLPMLGLARLPNGLGVAHRDRGVDRAVMAATACNG